MGNVQMIEKVGKITVKVLSEKNCNECDFLELRKVCQDEFVSIRRFSELRHAFDKAQRLEFPSRYVCTV